MIDDLELHREDLDHLFRDVHAAKEALRGYAKDLAWEVLGETYVDNPTGWTSWDIAPVYGPTGVLVALDFKGISHNDRGPANVRTIRVDFYQF